MVVLFVLRLNVQVNNFSVMLGQMCLAQGHNSMPPVGMEPILPLRHCAQGGIRAVERK